MLSYRAFESFESRFGRDVEDGRFAVEHWLDRHGESFVARFDANSWLTLSHAMDTHDIARGRGDLASVLRGLEIPACLVGISSDALYPAAEVKAVAEAWPTAEYVELTSDHGHDGFLIEEGEVSGIVAAHLKALATAGVDRLVSVHVSFSRP
jgi:homoserine O-acetyltransferase